MRVRKKFGILFGVGVQSRHESDVRAWLRLTLTPGLGPVLIARLVARFGSPDAVFSASAAELAQVQGISESRSATLARAIRDADTTADRELEAVERIGGCVIPIDHADYPPLLREIADPPPVLYVRGNLAVHADDFHAVAVVGSRRCTSYGIEQAERFSGVLARAGLTIASGGARGIDTAAHRGALRAQGRTIAVLGCGLGRCYPPENAELFEKVAANGALVSELPIDTPPNSENFPARNRIISGLALGVLVIEAGDKSGALITARKAGAEHGREVMVVPGRVDSPASHGSHQLLKKGEGLLVTEPGDVLDILRQPAGHHHDGTHAVRYAPARDMTDFASSGDDAAGEAVTPQADRGLFEAERAGGRSIAQARGAIAGDGGRRSVGLLNPVQTAILAALEEPKTIDQLAVATGLAMHQIRAELTMLEIQRRVRRDGPRLERV